MPGTDILDSKTRAHVDQWLTGDYDPETKQEIERLLEEDPQAVIDAFYTSLSFGTGGLRGIVGVGTNRMNKYVVMKATQGLANYITKHALDPSLASVVIGYDSRNHSRAFAEEAARVLAANGIGVYVFSALRPTPQISFACRQLKCQAAIIITASHNPPEYNGYKVYWEDGGQIVPPHDAGIIAEVRAIKDLSAIQSASIDHPKIQWLGEEIDALYLDAIAQLQHYPEQNQKSGSELKVVYSGLHGTGITLVPPCLERWGFTQLSVLEEQSRPDGNFPSVKSPNPEDASALEQGVERLKEVEGDILLANDPDADRLACVVRHHGKVVYLNGNQLGCICLEHLCSALKNQEKLPANAAVVKTIVTTELFHHIAQDHGLPCFSVLTGFKYIAALVHRWETRGPNYQFIFGAEESFGYLLGDEVRDKDGVSTCALVAEVALHAKLQGKTLVDLLNEIYQRHGVYREQLSSIIYGEGKADRERMDKAMNHLRQAPPKELCGIQVVSYDDYLSGEHIDAITGQKESSDLPKANVFTIKLEDGSKVIVRPSGTEPKVKLYGSAAKTVKDALDIAVKDCDQTVKALLEAVSDILKTET